MFRFFHQHALIYGKRSMATFRSLNIEPTGKGYSILQLNRNPSNSINLEMCKELINAFDALEKDKSCRGVVLESKLSTFSGLDYLEVYRPDPNRLKTFWLAIQDMMIKIFSSPLVVISAINGECKGVGCVLPLSSDYRIMGDGDYIIGMNATSFHLAVPIFLSESLKLLVGHREAERMLSLSILSTPHEALKQGLVDEVVPSDQLLACSSAVMEKWLKIPDVGRIKTKESMRKNFLLEFEKYKTEDLDLFVNGIQQECLQTLLDSIFKPSVKV